MAKHVPGRIFVLANSATGKDSVLGAFPDGRLSMFETRLIQPAERSAIVWQTAETHIEGYYRLHNELFGSAKALDVLNDDGISSVNVLLATTGAFSGQLWKLHEWGDGTLQLTNVFTGPSKNLDVIANTRVPVLRAGNLPTQHWSLQSSFATSTEALLSELAAQVPLPQSPPKPKPSSPGFCFSSLSSDLVRDMKLETLTTGQTTTHVHRISIVASKQRSQTLEETWVRKQSLGRGGFGAVWLETCTEGPKLGQSRAVKEIPKIAESGPVDYGRELEAIAKFSHPRYIHCFVQSDGWWESSRSIFIAMEFLEQRDLQSFLKDPLEESPVKVITRQLVEGVVFMHENGFAHRDLKLSNILVVTDKPDWWVKISDFGTTKRIDEDSLRTQIGTRSYAAPEVLGIFTLPDLELVQKEDRHAPSVYTLAVDVWSLGIITYRLLTLQMPFNDAVSLSQYVTLGRPFSYQPLIARNISSHYLKFLEKTLEASPSKRPAVKDLLSTPWLDIPEQPRSTLQVFGGDTPEAFTEACAISDPSAAWSDSDKGE